MMTPVSPIWAKLALASMIVLISAFITEMIAELKENKWNVLKTLIEFLKDF